MSDEAKAQTEERLRKLQNTGREKQAIAQQVQGQILQPIRDRIIKAIEAVAIQQKLTGVMENTTFLYVDKSVDITYDVLKQLKNGK
jgi:Skp family chaperone for outer membrane proteins